MSHIMFLCATAFFSWFAYIKWREMQETAKKNAHFWAEMRKRYPEDFE